MSEINRLFFMSLRNLGYQDMNCFLSDLHSNSIIDLVTGLVLNAYSTAGAENAHNYLFIMNFLRLADPLQTKGKGNLSLSATRNHVFDTRGSSARR